MTDESASELMAHLSDLGQRIETAVAEFHQQGALHGADREAAADLKVRHAALEDAAKAGGKSQGELSHDISVLKLTFEKWLAHVDHRAESGKS